MDNTLQVHAAAVRKALGPYRSLLKTESRRGYRLLGSWTVRHKDAPRQSSGLQKINASRESPRSNIPAAVTRSVGRAAAAQRLRDLLSAYRVVTLTGPGGIGKTTLGLKVARRVHREFADGSWLVELASLLDPDLVPATVAGTLGLKISGENISADAVARVIGAQQLLLVLDNCEHIIDAVANLTEVLVRSCPRITILATSREMLRIDGECVFRVLPLEVPGAATADPDHILGHSAVELFVARIQALASDFSPRASDLQTIATICRHLDGIPLAIEFAAARAAMLGVQQVTTDLRDRFALLSRGRRTALPRHRTLRAVLDWSHGLLTDAERLLLRRLAVFPAGFTLTAAVAVMTDSGLDAATVTDGIANLVAKSLVELVGTDGTARWRLLETIRAYALEKLVEHDEADAAARRHAVYFRDLLTPLASVARSSFSDVDLAGCAREIDNVRSALDWSFSAAGDAAIGIALTAAYVPIWLHSALLVECHERSARALSILDPNTGLTEQLRLQLHIGFGLAACLLGAGPVGETRTVLATALDIAESLNDLDAQLWAMWGLWMLHYFSGESHAALSLAERLSVVASHIGEPFALIISDRLIGNVLHNQGDQHRAQVHLERVVERSVTLATRRNNLYPQVDQRLYARTYLSRVLSLRGYLDQAVAQARTSFAEAIATGYENNICQALRVAVCPVALTIGDLAAAEQSIARLADVANSFDAPFTKGAAQCLEGTLLIKRGAFEAGSALLRSELDACERTGWTNWYTEFLGTYAEGLAGLGQFSEALAAVDEALAKADQRGERYYVAELLRLKGELLIAESDGRRTTAIDECFSASVAAARDQGALLFELRAALGLARWRIRHDRPEDARQILASVYGRFVEGFGAADLRAAKTLLATLDGPPR
jgi:predicted ATPase